MYILTKRNVPLSALRAWSIVRAYYGANTYQPRTKCSSSANGRDNFFPNRWNAAGTNVIFAYTARKTKRSDFSFLKANDKRRRSVLRSDRVGRLGKLGLANLYAERIRLDLSIVYVRPYHS